MYGNLIIYVIIILLEISKSEITKHDELFRFIKKLLLYSQQTTYLAEFVISTIRTFNICIIDTKCPGHICILVFQTSFYRNLFTELINACSVAVSDQGWHLIETDQTSMFVRFVAMLDVSMIHYH